MTDTIVSYLQDWEIERALESRTVIRCKFVLINDPEGCTLVWGPISRFPYHANLVDRYCEEQLIRTSWRKMPDVLDIRDPSVRMNGGGMIELDPTRQKALFGGISRAYGSYEPATLRSILEAQPFLDGYAVEVV